MCNAKSPLSLIKASSRYKKKGQLVKHKVDVYHKLNVIDRLQSYSSAIIQRGPARRIQDYVCVLESHTICAGGTGGLVVRGKGHEESVFVLNSQRTAILNYDLYRL